MMFAIIALCLSLLLGVFLSRIYNEKKLIIWGLVTMFSVAPFFSWIIAILYGTEVENGFAAMGILIVLFPVLFLVGIGILFAGIYKKVTGENL
ncbi:hypothetical protein FIU87_04860 [Bacillus sp. THAF10]|uniref:hypothetical protein n=1 Tax=Bacillus sp. THAF10 TaxID=2587848 RepID=UPI00126875D5|nr:hypothetical protein [Bacillus sp. THAF10]QFT87980.1 hypothetical protein FIU87_04860 [Bacillus sp. THAF10]